MRTIDLRGQSLSVAGLLAAMPRAGAALQNAQSVAADIVADVRARGEAALREQAERFDHVSAHALRVPQAHIDDAVATLAPEVRSAIEESIRRVRLASLAQVPAARVTDVVPGARITQRWQPVGRVGVYVPGGKAVYPSSVIMNVVPAQVAGVASLALASPPQADHDGRVHPTILGAAGLLGVSEVYAMGGAGAIGAYAYGVESIGLDPVDVITGPGNNFVAAAKRAVAGVVGTDSEAGATEILIVADDTADARLVAADLVSQAEHDEQAGVVLVTASPELADAVRAQVDELVAKTKHVERARRALAGEQSAVILVDDFAGARAVSNAYGPEHLELHVRDAADRAEGFTNAGALFIGAMTPVSLGDYMAGSNHVLPTGGSTRHSSGLGAHTFLRPQQVIEYTKEALAGVHDSIVAFATAEDLPAHGEAVTARFS